MLAEFRSALQAEIKAAQRQASSNAIPLSNGERIGKVGHLLQYRFTVDSFLNLPGDMPGDLVISGSPPIPVTIVGIDGLNITLSVEVSLPKFIPQASLRTNLTYLLRRLIERIEDMAEKPNPAGDRIRGAAAAGGQAALVDVPRLNSNQLKAVASSLGRDTTFIWGPPGTGKTETIGRIAEQLCRRERSVLLVSHTNNALDEALLRFVAFLGDDLKEGQAVRVGVSKNEKLLARDNDEKTPIKLQLEKLVEKKETELVARKTALQVELNQIREQLEKLEKELGLWEWVQTARDDLAAATRRLASLDEIEARCASLRSTRDQVAQDMKIWHGVVAEARDAKVAGDKAEVWEGQIAKIGAEMEKVALATATVEASLEESRTLLARARDLEPLRGRRSQLPSLANSQAATAAVGSELAKARTSFQASQITLTAAKEVLAATTAANAFTRVWRGLPKPDVQTALVQGLEKRTQQELDAKTRIERAFNQATAMVREIMDLEQKLSPHRNVPRVDAMTKRVESLTAEVNKGRGFLATLRESTQATRQKIERMRELVAAFHARHGLSPQDALLKIAVLEERHGKAVQASQAADAERRILRLELEDQFGRWLRAVHQWGLTDEAPEDLREILSAITGAQRVASVRVKDLDATAVGAEIAALNSRASGVIGQITAIEEQMALLAEKIIADATVIAVTLTSAYLRDAIQDRKFDTVILDEASMAPIPALWIAGSLATANVVAVGDFKQLPPIVLSDDDTAQKWLGRDIFEAAGISAGDKLLEPTPDHFVGLFEQRRMHPEISQIPNELIYDRLLCDHTPTVTNEDDLRVWYRTDWGHDAPVLLVDTGSTKAWVTSVVKGASSSRLNFLSATVCVDLAEKIFREDLADIERQSKRRVIIICPYAPHAKLLRLLIKHQGLEKSVEAGTVHSFQGSEADVVIFDMVNDEPHWKVGLFTPAKDNDNRRLINVALTRAKRRLFIVGDFDYCEKLSRNAFLGKTFIPFLRARYPKVDAMEIIPPGLAARAADAQAEIAGGNIEAPHARTVVTQGNFFRVLGHDMLAARERIVIFSPFITQDRLGMLESGLKAAVERGVKVYVVTKAHGERGRDLTQYRFLERTLMDWGISLIHKLRMHEKLVFVDDSILWVGSLNPLSYSDTQEVMERRESTEVVKDYSSTLRLRELLEAFESDEVSCPVCGQEIIAAEGAEEPYYWRCVVDGCFTRSIGQDMPKNGVLACPNCSGELKFGEWGERYAWRCVENTRHRLVIHRHHLKLPKMAALVPKRARRGLEAQLGIEINFDHQQFPHQAELL